ncbi:MAG: SemiSWEET family sugar transporter [Cytophagaceae bacterium]
MNLLSPEFIGSIAGLLTTTSFLPQAWKTYKTKDTRSISLTMFIVFVLGVSMWIFYGILIGQYPVVIPNIITLFLATYILIMKIKNG